jgi:MFS family permease
MNRGADRALARLMPWLLLMYVLSYLDRANIGFAKNAFQASTGISEAAYALGAGIFSIGYALVEIPSNLMLRRFGARRWLSRIMVTWGLVSASLMFVRTDTQFYAVRFLLGITEAGFFPGVILYLTYWFPDARRARVNGLFYFGAPLSFVFGGPLSGFLLDIDGTLGLHGWQWMFMVEGLLASCVGVLIWFKLTDRPADAAWLPEPERRALTAVLAAEDHAKLAHGPAHALAALRDWRVLYFAAIYFLIQMCVSGVTYYLPAQIGRLLGRHVGFVVGVVTAVPWTCALVAAFLVPRLADRLGQRRLVAAATLLTCACGVAISAAAPPMAALAALCVAVAGFIAVQPLFWTFPTAYLGGAAAAGGLALVNSLGALSGFVSPSYRLWADNTFGAGAGLYALSLTTVLGSMLIAALSWLLRPAH